MTATILPFRLKLAGTEITGADVQPIFGIFGQLLNNFEVNVKQNGAIDPCAKLAFAILAECASFAAEKNNVHVIDKIERHTEMYNDRCFTPVPRDIAVMDIMHIFLVLLRYAGKSQPVPVIKPRLPLICLALWQSTLQHLEYDPDLNSFTLIDMIWHLYFALSEARSEDARQAVHTISEEVLKWKPVRGPAEAWHNNDSLLLGLVYGSLNNPSKGCPLAPFKPRVWNDASPQCRAEQGRLRRLKTRHRALMVDNRADATELKHITKCIEALERWRNFSP